MVKGSCFMDEDLPLPSCPAEPLFRAVSGTGPPVTAANERRPVGRKQGGTVEYDFVSHP